MRPDMDDTREAVLNRLAAVDRAAGQADPSAVLPMARAELHRIAESWRELLTTHSVDANGRCAACRTRLRARRWPCQVWRSAHEQLIGDGVSHRQRTYPLRDPLARLTTR